MILVFLFFLKVHVSVLLVHLCPLVALFSPPTFSVALSIRVSLCVSRPVLNNQTLSNGAPLTPLTVPCRARLAIVIDVEAYSTRQRLYSQFSPVLCLCFWIFSRAKCPLFSCLDTAQQKTVVLLFPRILQPSSTNFKPWSLHFGFTGWSHQDLKQSKKTVCLMQLCNAHLSVVYVFKLIWMLPHG